MVSLKELARLVGVSPTTVSFVLNGREKEMRISKEVTEKILAMATRMSYRPNTIAVALRTGQTKIIGLIVEDISNNFFSTLAKTIEEQLNAYDYKVVYCSTENQEKKGRELINMLRRQQVDGYLITPSAGMVEQVKELLNKEIPVVQIDRYFEQLKCPFVMVDNYQGIVQGVEHLQAKGKKRIGFVTVDLDMVQMKDRLAGYTATLKRLKLPATKKQILSLHYGDTKEESVLAIRNFLKKEKLDSVIFSTNYVGIAGLQAIKELGLKIPEELAVICFDDNELFNLCTPTITSIRQPIELIAKQAVQILMGQLGVIKAQEESEVKIPMTMIFRESV